MSRLRRALPIGTERRGSSVDPATGLYSNGAIPPNSLAGGVGLSDTGEIVTERRALQNWAVYASTSLIADSVGMLPVGGYRALADGGRDEVTPKPALLASPYAELDPIDWTHCVVSSLVLRGNAYLYVAARDSLGRPTQLIPIHPDDVAVSRDRQTRRVVYLVGGDRQAYSGGVNGDIQHIRGYTIAGALEGLSPIGFHAQTIGLGLAAQKFGARWLGDSAAPSSVLETDQALTDEQIVATQQDWIASQGGNRRPAVLSGGFRWRAITIQPNESQFLETQELSANQIAGLYRVPPHMIGLVAKSTSWGTGIEEQVFGYVTFTLDPWLIRLEQRLTSLLPKPQFARYNRDALLRGRTLDRFNAYVQARNAGWLNVDEIRALEDRPPLPDGAGQSYNAPLNMGTLGPNGTVIPPTADPPQEDT